jgi:hypothetical protein
MSIISRQAVPAYTEEQVRDWIRTQEATYGEIARIGNEDQFTVASFYRFDPAHPRPEVEAELERSPADSEPRDGELCRGEVYIENALQHVIVYRPDSDAA